MNDANTHPICTHYHSQTFPGPEADKAKRGQVQTRKNLPVLPKPSGACITEWTEAWMQKLTAPVDAMCTPVRPAKPELPVRTQHQNQHLKIR